MLSSCLAIVTLIPEVSGYPTGAPPEGCRSMLPGHGVPAQTGTTNPYTVMTDRTVFSCPGDEIRGYRVEFIINLNYRSMYDNSHMIIRFLKGEARLIFGRMVECISDYLQVCLYWTN